MNDARKRRQAKQARRDAQRLKTHEAPEETSGEPPEATTEGALLLEEVRRALATGHPLDLLGIASLMIEATKPNPLAAYVKSRAERPTVRLDDLIAGFIGLPVPETTALLAVLAELLVDDEDLRLTCATEVAARDDSLPRWILGLSHGDVYRAVRMTHVLGDGDELLIGARLAGGHELTCVAHIDHLSSSTIKDAFFVPDSLDRVVSVAEATNTDPDTSFVDMSLADARAWIQYALDRPLFTRGSDSWPDCRTLVQWLIGHMPDGGQKYEPPWDEESTEELCDQFFNSPAGAPFDDYDHRELLSELLATGDPLRWSETRMAEVFTRSFGEGASLQAVLDVPALLRAYVPFAHAQSGIRDELTADALAVIDEMSPGHERT
ncbi:hypothetical protein [Mycolicibacterium sp. P9-64]|uniref:hypothetical protein n=1 Tax=Mycolicibacterium sp. P9-64 TaxID=2024612 RepID=UPI0018D997E4|nr:hypothetical protein [Mycolicibacterium sp. P9-64]